jgi:hypothetical protein
VHHVERLALGQALGHVDEHDVREIRAEQQLCGGGAYLTRADHRDLRICHETPPMRKRPEAVRGA